MSDMIQDLMTPQEVTRYLKVSKNKIYQLVKQNNMPAYVIGGNLRFSKEQIDTWLCAYCGKNIAPEVEKCRE